MKTNSTKNWIKVAGLTLAIGTFAFSANAQNTTTAVANIGVVKNSDVATTPVASGTVRLIDNKGTVKYLQVQNGLTAITNKATDGSGVTTTWQLGGKLTDNTYIDANSNVFGLDGLQVTTGTAATTATPSHTATTGAGTWTVLVHNELTGAVEKLLFSNFLQVQAGQIVMKVGAGAGELNPSTPTITIATNIPTSDVNKISVYRNGAKLIAGTDYTYTNPTVELKPAVSTYGDWALYTGDVIEVQWVK